MMMMMMVMTVGSFSIREGGIRVVSNIVEFTLYSNLLKMSTVMEFH